MPLKAPARTVDLNLVLAGTNVLVLALNLMMFGRVAGNPYVDRTSILLAGLLALQTQTALLLERRRRDPFVILVAFTMIFFFALRVFTLALYPQSAVFERFPYTAANTNFALAFIVAANLLLYVGLAAAHRGRPAAVESGGWVPRSPTASAVLLFLSVVFAYSSDRFWAGNVPRALNFLVLLLSQNILVLMAFAYVLLFRRALSRFHVVILATLIVTEAALHLLYGSRSAITGLIQNYMLVALAISGSVKLRRSWMVLGALLTPLLAALLVWSFVGTTFVRGTRSENKTFDPEKAVELTREASSKMSTEQTLDLLLPPLFERVGFLDFSAEVMANRDRYRDLITPSSYFKSLVDNELTPGFDVFDQPKISNGMRFVYEGLGPPSKRMVGSDEIGYQSDQLGLYGELFALFGFGSLPLFFLFAYGAKRLYLGLRPTTPFRLTMKRLVILSAFLSAINSYGLDWVVIETVPLVIGVVVYGVVFADRRAGERRRRVSPAAAMVPHVS